MLNCFRSIREILSILIRKPGWLLLLSLSLSLCLQPSIFAQEKVNTSDRIVGSTFKALAKAFVVITDINQLKKDNIDRLKKMDGEKFKKKYTEVYAAIKDLPLHLKISYGINENMTKDEAIKAIGSLDKDKVYQIIDSVPDAFIANQFKSYLGQTKQKIQKSNVVQQVNKLWNKMIQEAG